MFLSNLLEISGPSFDSTFKIVSIMPIVMLVLISLPIIVGVIVLIVTLSSKKKSNKINIPAENAKVEDDGKHCQYCSAEIPENSAECKSCGAKLTKQK